MNWKHSLVVLLTAAACAGCSANSTALSVEPTSGGSSEADVEATFEARVAQLAAPHVDPSGAQGKAVGLVVGVSSPNVSTILGFGATSSNGAEAPDGDSIFEIGSVTKVFTGYLLARALARGDVTLDDPIDPYFPAGAPRYDGCSITLLDLATHTSGLRNMPTNLHGSSPNPAAGYTVADLESFMAGYQLKVEPGTHFRYSNLGTGVLGYVLQLEAGLPDYESLARREVADPLGLYDTMITWTPEQESRRLQGHAGDKPMPPNRIGPGLGGGGALRSTAEDLLHFIEAASGDGPADAVSAWALVLEPRRASPYGENGRTGLLINVRDYGGLTVYSKSGGTAGFSSQIAFTTSPPAAVVLLANSSRVEGLGELALAILDELIARQ